MNAWIVYWAPTLLTDLKFIDTDICYCYCTGKDILKCSQNGNPQMKDVSQEDRLPLSAIDFKPGTLLLVEHGGKFLIQSSL